MTNKILDESYLAKWLNGELSDEDLLALVGKADFKAYKKIKTHLNLFEAPQFNDATLLNAIQTKLKNRRKSVISLIPNWVYSTAASILLLLSVYLFFFANTNLTTNFGQQTAYNLKDGSFVKLNAKSTLSYHKRNWIDNRTVNLKGEAYFEVVKGSPFKVKTINGSITVLGTHFSVKSEKDYLKVTCFEGKVKVTTKDKSLILTQGDVYQFAKNSSSTWHIERDKPTWTQGIYSYQNTPLFVIIHDLEHQFKIKIDTKSIDTNILLTASYNKNNLDLALKSIFIPLNFDYKLIDGKFVALSKK